MTKFCEECGRQFTNESTKFCGNCGAPRTSTVLDETPLEQQAASLATKLHDEHLGPAEIQAILETHADCFAEDLCEICEFWEESDDFEQILNELATKENATPDQQNLMLEAAAMAQGRLESVCFFMASNPNVSQEVKDLLLGSLDWTEYGDDLEQLGQDLVETMRGNARFTSLEVKAFLQLAREKYGLKLS